LICNAFCGGAALSAPAGLWIGLYTTEPDVADANGVEIATDTYVRQPVTLGAWSSGTRASTADIFFPVAGASWGTIVAFGLWDAVSSGNLWFRGSCTSTAITTNQRYEVLATYLTIGLAYKVT